MIKEDNHVFQGMRRGRHPIKQENGALWDAHNIRITDKEDNTLFSITNEKGTSEPLVTLKGNYVGHCVINNYLVVFTAYTQEVDNEIKPKDCRIYRIECNEDSYSTVELYYKEGVWDKGWSPEYPIEAFGVYESLIVQKVYWVDGRNQPRVINIVKEDPDYHEYSFDFVQSLTFNETVEVERLQGEGLFTPGTIQYAFTYYNRYGQESNIFYTTPLQYITFSDRGGSPDEVVSNSFKITIENLDRRFEYLRIYSIHRSSIDTAPLAHVVADLEIIDDKISYIDSGVSEETIDPQLLLYIGGREIAASTMCLKDNTLFFGDIKLEEGKYWNEVKEEVTKKITDSQWVPVQFDPINLPDSVGRSYSYTSTIDNPKFKSNETYRCGIQFQHRTGRWSDPIFLKDDVLNTVFPRINDNTIQWHSKGINISKELSSYLRDKDYLQARTCVVLPNRIDRDVICQGILCPTLYSVEGRSGGVPYAMSSWMFRATPLEYTGNKVTGTEALTGNYVYKGSQIEYRHNRPLFSGSNRGAEIQCMPGNSDVETVENIKSSRDQSNFYFVDSNIVTMHSPEVEFDEYISNLALNEDFELKIIGDISQDAVYGDISLQTSSPARSSKASGFVHRTVGYQTGDTKAYQYGANGGLVSGAFYNDGLIMQVDPDGDTEKNVLVTPVYHMVYLWHRSGAVNNDSQQSKYTDTVINSALLDRKRIANLKFFDRFSPLQEGKVIKYDVTQPRIFNSDQVVAQKLWIPYLGKEVVYYGNMDTMAITPSDKEYDLYNTFAFSGVLDKIQETATSSSNKVFNTASDPVRIKYKSSPHLVFSLYKKGQESSTIPILPVRRLAQYTNPDYKIPDWDINNKDNYAGSMLSDDILVISKLSSGSTMKTQVLKETDATRSQIGTLRYCSDNNSSNNKTFIYCVQEGTSDSHPGVSWAAAKALVKEGTIFKIIGDGKSCMVSRDDLKVLGESPELKSSFYVGEDRYYKAVNVSYPTEAIVRADLEEIDNPTTGKDEEDKDEGGSDNTQGNKKTFRIDMEYTDESQETSITAPTILLAELRRKNVLSKFGGDTDSDKKHNIWIPAGDPVPLSESKDVVAKFEHGDTWYSRYDCLKTYPFTTEDENAVVEVGSFMCETRINIDGRYDKNRGTLSVLSINPQNFNHINPVYSQRDNFFNYHILDEDFFKVNNFSNQIVWSLEKANSEEIDNWTKVTLANYIDVDGTKGKVTALRTNKDNLLCFQEKAFGQLLYNSRVQISTSDGVPIEIANSHKMEGYRLISENVGCSNKWSIISTDKGVYFIDNNTGSLQLYGTELQDISKDAGLSRWFNVNHPGAQWNPRSKTINGIRSFIDIEEGDLYFSPGPASVQEDALCYSEKLGQFVSFMSYGGVQGMFNLGNDFYTLKESSEGLKLYKNNAGEYNNFFGEVKGWDFSFISNAVNNENSTVETKIFDTVELRTDHWNSEGNLLNTCPINFLKVSNEYQEAMASSVLNTLNMRKKFRVWRSPIPRAVQVAKKGEDAMKGYDIERPIYGRARIRNPWTMVTLGWDPRGSTQLNNSAIIHDATVKYSV